ncbi:MAG: XisI protein [Cyanobacteria bacterium CRU_2_1]|nr:XisI protein [Cyanobacteria bacterium CRU_2_1]
MAKLEDYSNIIQRLLNQYCQLSSSGSEVETELIVDCEHHHYQLVQVGWQNNRRVYGCILHLDIKDGKIWLQHNGTERQVADELVALGVPKQDIVLGFQSPSKRKFTEFAIG